MVGGAFLACFAGAASVHAQAEPPPGASPRNWSAGAQGIPLWTRVAPAVAGQARSEVYLTQPNLMGHVRPFGGPVEMRGTLNLEWLTLRRGELNPGIWGEGYVDRRHPHTFVHEAMVVLRPGGAPGGARVSAAAGKGFVPFGTDDPMVRPLVKYPINHHYAQILERWVATAALRTGPLTLEGALFNGDEPEGPGDWPSVRRFGDSWSLRATLAPGRHLEASASFAAVESPEHPVGEVLDQRKWSGALRWERAPERANRTYLLLEWARNDEYDRGTRAFSFSSLLAEGAVRRRGTEIAARFEQTARPESERLLDPFRAPVPHHHVSILGVTRWRIATLGASLGLDAPFGRLRPFLEVSHLRPSPLEPNAVFQPEPFYGSDRIWSFSGGMRVEVGTVHRRMGRYGVVEVEDAGGAPHAHHP